MTTTTATTTIATMSPMPVDHGNTSVPTDSDHTGAFGVSMTTMRSPCGSCDNITSAFVVIDNDEAALSAGEFGMRFNIMQSDFGYSAVKVNAYLQNSQ